MSGRKYVASEMLRAAASRHGVHLSELVAETALWVHPGVHAKLVEAGSAAMFSNVRRARPGRGEKRGQIVNGVRLDDNSYANRAIKLALGMPRNALVGFEACHIWPLTCYDARYHTAVANLVLLPRALAGLSDHEAEIQLALQYRAFELYRWYPEGTGEPQRPAFYPATWLAPELSSTATTRSTPHAMPSGHNLDGSMSEEERAMLVQRVRRWAAKPDLNVHRIIGIVVRAEDGISRQRLIAEAGRVTGSQNAYGAVASLLTSRGNNYGRVLEEVAGKIRLHPAIEAEVRSLRWSY